MAAEGLMKDIRVIAQINDVCHIRGASRSATVMPQKAAAILVRTGSGKASGTRGK
jgi:hypothetical protein